MEPESDWKSRRSVRLPKYDYSNVEMYFATICSSERRCIFGRVHANNVVLTPLGEIIRNCWTEIPHHFPNIKIETYVVMPNHIHGILTIQTKLPNDNQQVKSTVSMEAFGKPRQGSLPTIIRSFKSAVSKRARESGSVSSEPIWQKGYYEHVIRNTKEYVEITNYILQNPARWADDEDNPNRK
jgi:putative transposase